MKKILCLLGLLIKSISSFESADSLELRKIPSTVLEEKIPQKVLRAYKKECQIFISYTAQEDSAVKKNILFYNLEDLKTPLASIEISLSDPYCFILRPHVTHLEKYSSLFLSTSSLSYRFDFNTGDIEYISIDNKAIKHVVFDDFVFFNKGTKIIYGYSLQEKTYVDCDVRSCDKSTLYLLEKFNKPIIRYCFYAQNCSDSNIYSSIKEFSLSPFRELITYSSSCFNALSPHLFCIPDSVKIIRDTTVYKKTQDPQKYTFIEFKPLDGNLVQVDLGGIFGINDLNTKNFKELFQSKSRVEAISKISKNLYYYYTSDKKAFLFNTDTKQELYLQTIDDFTIPNAYHYLNNSLNLITLDILFYNPTPTPAQYPMHRKKFFLLNLRGQKKEYLCPNQDYPITVIQKNDRILFKKAIESLWDVSFNFAED